MPQYQWLSIGDTRILMHLQGAGERPEWHPIAQITLRQIYATVKPMYYAWKSLAEGRVPTVEEPIGKYETIEEAIWQTERSVGVVSTKMD